MSACFFDQLEFFKVPHSFFLICFLASCLLDNSNDAAETTEKFFEESVPAEIVPEIIGYDNFLAARLDADDYGMYPHVMTFLKSSPNKDRIEEERAELQRTHGKHRQIS